MFCFGGRIECLKERFTTKFTFSEEAKPRDEMSNFAAQQERASNTGFACKPLDEFVFILPFLVCSKGVWEYAG